MTCPPGNESGSFNDLATRNVREWCEHVYDGTFYGKPEALVLDPVSTTGSGNRVCRGGFFFFFLFARNARSAGRFGDRPSDRLLLIGFRLARPLP